MLLIEPFDTEVSQFIQAPFPLWEIALNDKLVQSRYDNLGGGIGNRLNYNTGSIWLEGKSDANKQFLAGYGKHSIYLEKPNFSALSDFYAEHGLVPLTERELVKNRIATKLKKALNVLGVVPDCLRCIVSLVNCIQLIWSEGPEYDSSYSHPDIPFTIFVSVCEDDSAISNIRVAESILHEAMHLKLSLVEKAMPLVEEGSIERFYSPWRNEYRPLRGVLHGLFVFRAILDFYHDSMPNALLPEMKKFINDRLEEINSELSLLHDFPNTNGLTSIGKELALRLLEIKRG